MPAIFDAYARLTDAYRLSLSLPSPYFPFPGIHYSFFPLFHSAGREKNPSFFCSPPTPNPTLCRRGFSSNSDLRLPPLISSPISLPVFADRIPISTITTDGAEAPQEICDSSTSVVQVSPLVMKKLSGMPSIDSVEAIALMKIPARFRELGGDQEEIIYQNWFPSPNRILVLDGIQDPGNLGTLIRSAMAFKWDGVFLLPGCCDPFNEKALRAARGVSFQLPVVSGNWSNLRPLKTKIEMKMLAGHPANVSDGSD